MEAVAVADGHAIILLPTRKDKLISSDMTKSIKNIPVGGYTMIELLVALTIVGLLFGVGYANFRDFTRRQSLVNSTKKIIGDLRDAQQMALSGQIPNDASCRGNNYLNGYFFRVISANHYEIRASCSGGAVANVAKDVYLPPTVTIVTPFPNPNPILFKVLGNGTNIGATNAQIRVRQSGSSATNIINVSSGGQIQ